ncbi:hypothetical protein H2O64_23550 [Kordia sp. YSTF-M3]|uniref:UDP-glucuronosyltransferase n=1 Tax=Kordia aestuariivivens TaxID=2759037 RepID=A0ABR7QGF9_9FLAO|nr:hypothetical protein [Kordia aestuariivivens]MBC8757664.1 hypothetical protein [Kordia aestuariivivens]
MKNKETDTINIVSSIIGYGVYFPALILFEQLKALGYNVNIYIIERFFDEKATSEFERTKTAFKKDVRLVQIASRIPVKYTEKLSIRKTEALFQEWSNNNSTHFLCFSGLWLETLHAYKNQHPNCTIDACRVDSAVAATWGMLSKHTELITNDLSFFTASENKINYVLNIPEIQPVPYLKRENNVTIHGGGWDLGDFTTTTEQFTNYHVNLIVNDLNVDFNTKNTTLHANKPHWNPLYEDGFPPFGRMNSDNSITFKANKKHPGILNVLAKSNAIVSKPGGMTLMDSLITETPLIFLKSVGKNENSNKKLWETLQLGIPIETWQKSEHQATTLTEMHERIIAIKKETPCFLKTYINLLNNS